MKTKLTFLLVISFLFSIFILTSCASRPNTRTAYFKNGKEVECYENDCKVRQDVLYCDVFAKTGTPPPNYRRSPSNTSNKVTTHSGTITDSSSGSMYTYSGTSRTERNYMSEGLNDMSNALGSLAQSIQYQRQVENRFDECMNIMMGYNVVQVPIGYSNPPDYQRVDTPQTSVPYGAAELSDECNVNVLTWGGQWGSTIPRNQHCIASNPHSKK